MRKAVLLLCTCILCWPCFSQYWQQQVNYNIDVTLNDKDKTLDAFEKIKYINNSPDTLHFIWFHIWPNAYKNDRTAFSDQMLLNGNTRFYFSGKEEKGYINQLDFKVNGTTAQITDHPLYADIIKLILPSPLPPAHEITITTPFHEKLPFNFSRGGYDGSTFQITQWYPKPAVYDRSGWHPITYLDQGEYYSEFGNFEVQITAPSDFVIAATGNLQEKNEMEWMKHHSSILFQTQNQRVKHSSLHDHKNSKSKIMLPPAVPMKTIHFKEEGIHDFAWFANRNFIVENDTCLLPSGHIINVSSYYTIREQKMWDSSIQFIKEAMRFYSREVGDYPYNNVSAVQGPQSFGGGMEYPTITLIAPSPSLQDLDETIAHELGHNWFYGLLASNERDYPWMDEGINTFYQYKYVKEKYGDQTMDNELLFQTKVFRHTDQPIDLSAQEYSATNYQMVVYHKTAEWMKLLETKTGEESFRQMMHQYFEKWKFKHPYPEDFKNEVGTILKDETDTFFDLIHKKGLLPGHEFKGVKMVSPLIPNSLNDFLLYPSKRIIGFSPAIGANNYDKLMIGGLITNYKLPPEHFSYFVIPLYGTGSKNITGLGKLNYTIQSKNRTDLFFNASTFSMNELTDDEGNKHFMKFTKLVPGIKFWFREKDPLSTVQKYLQWKTYFINEQTYQGHLDSVIVNNDTSVVQTFTFPWQKRYVNQLKFVYENYRTLYPFDITAQIEQSTYFIRPTLTTNYFFNYAKGGGLQLRFFAGKFIYINHGSDLLVDDRYFLNLTGPRGNEDYTYSDYFIGRNDYNGITSQQLMIRDGGFKVGTDLLLQKVGKTDNWLTAVNFISTIPDKINPLSLLPIPIHLSAFLDVGTYADLWQTNGNNHFLYDAGIQLPLLRGIIQVYIPVFYSNDYRDYFKSYISSNRFLKTISFSINLYNKDLQKINREVLF